MTMMNLGEGGAADGILVHVAENGLGINSEVLFQSTLKHRKGGGG